MNVVASRELRLRRPSVTGLASWVAGCWRRRPRLWDGIRGRLVLLALVATAPLLVLVAVNASQDVATARREAQAEALRVAQLQADMIDEHVLAVQTLLDALSPLLSTEPGSQGANAALLQNVLAHLLESSKSSYTGLFLTSPGAELPGVSAANGVLLSRPVVAPDGHPTAMLNAATRLDRLPRLETRDLPPGSLMMVLDERGTVLAHSPDSDVWVGRDLAQLEFVRQALRTRQGAQEGVSADGVPRLAAYTTTTRVPWLVYVGLPSEIVLGSSRVAFLRNLWFGALALGAAVLLGWLIAGRIAAPLRHLAADAAAVGAGDLGRRADASTGGEVGVLARVFNQMAEDVERHVQDVRASQVREQEARLTAEATARQLADREQRLQDLVRRLQVAQEDERRRVAYEIHDGLAQVAASAHQHLQTFADYHVPASDSEREALERTVELVQRTVREARRLIAGLRPTVLDDFGLSTAIRLETEALASDGWQVTYAEDIGEQRLPSQIETALFRVAQEAMTNIRKHAGRARVEVTLERVDKRVRLEVRDDGRGFDTASTHERARPGERVGLLGMQERVRWLNGRCTVNSAPGEGTDVVAEVPLSMDMTSEGSARGG